MTGPRTLVHTTLDLYEVAHLAGGPERVADTAVVALLGRGLLRLDTACRLQAVGPVGGHPVEAALLEAVGPRARRSAASVRGRLALDPRIVAVGERLTAAGLLRRNPMARLRSGWPCLVRTGAGRRLLAQWQVEPPAAVGSDTAVRVALAGHAGMGDRELRDSVFGTPLRPTPRSRGGRPWHAGHHARVTPYSAGGGGVTADGGGWGGGGWGGDGGCGGGDGGGGGC
jgi:hypothetical protein